MQKELKNKINDFEELQEITPGDRTKEHTKCHEAAIRYGMVKGEQNE